MSWRSDTGETLKTFPDATDAEVEQAIAAAHEAFLSWRERSFTERGAILQRAADLLRAKAGDYAKLLTLEMGKITAEALAEVELSARIFEYYVKNAEAIIDVNIIEDPTYNLVGSDAK